MTFEEEILFIICRFRCEFTIVVQGLINVVSTGQHFRIKKSKNQHH